MKKISRKSKKLVFVVISCLSIVTVLTSLFVLAGVGIKNMMGHDKNVAKTEEIKKEKNTKTKPEGEATIAFTGDFLLEDALYDWIGDDYDFKDYFDKVEPLLKADLTITNMEVPIGGEELQVSGSNFRFNAPYEVAEKINELPINYLTLANNHTFDRGMEGIENTIDILDKYNIGHTGAYLTEEDADTVNVVDVNGIKVAILAYTYGTNQPQTNLYSVPNFLSRTSRAFTNQIQQYVKEQVEAAKEGADFVIAACHWGTEFTYDLSISQTTFAKFLADQGVDLIIGNHPHNIQEVEIMEQPDGQKTYCFYSMGNFVSAAANVDRASEHFTNMYEIGAIGRLTLKKDKKTGDVEVINPTISPIVNHFEEGYTNFQLIPFEDYTEEMAKKHLQREYSSDFNLEFLTNEIQDVLGSSKMLDLK